MRIGTAVIGLLAWGGAQETRAPGLLRTVQPAVPPAVPPAAKPVEPDVRPSRLLALLVPEGQAPAALVAPGPFTATFEGFLQVEARDRFTFTMAGTGELELVVAGQKVTLGTPLQLDAGPNALRATWRSPAQGAARLRVLWRSEEFGDEPLPVAALSHAPRPMAAVRGLTTLIELRCVRCHAADATAGPPDLAADGPDLRELGKRLRPSWVAAWIADPHALRPGARMPRMLPRATAAQDARDMAAFLAGSTEPPEEKPAAEDIAAGGQLFAARGCIACHLAPDQARNDHDPERVPLQSVARKFVPGALAAFLRKPDAHFGWIRMPDFQLDTGEARALAAFLLARAAAAPLPAVALADAARGGELLATTGCLACHTHELKDRRKAPPLSQLSNDRLDRGCLAADAGRGDGTTPDFALAAEQRDALAAFLRTDRSAVGRANAAEFAERRVEELRCRACHTRDAGTDLWSRHLGEVQQLGTEAAAQQKPHLTWVGEKLQVDWIARLLRGEVEPRTRPWLRARMPAFRAGAELLAAGLAQQHGCLPAEPEEDAADPARVKLGRTLVGKKGFSCVACHAVGEENANAVFEAPGPNLELAAGRLRKPYVLRWLMDPMRVEPWSKMPKYAEPGGRSPFTEHLEGDAMAQFDAIWQYLRAGVR